MKVSNTIMISLLGFLSILCGCGVDPTDSLEESLSGKAERFSAYNINYQMDQQEVVLDQDNLSFFLDNQPLVATLSDQEAENTAKRTLNLKGHSYLIRSGGEPFHVQIKKGGDVINVAKFFIRSFHRREGSQDKWEPMTVCGEHGCAHFSRVFISPTNNEWYVEVFNTWFQFSTEEQQEFLITPAILSDWSDIEGEYHYQIEIEIDHSESQITK